MDPKTLDGIKVLIVDDEPDIIETVIECIEMCQVDSSLDFPSARKMLRNNKYDAAILDIMGVNGYGLLEVAVENKIPVLILTAHALSADNFKKSIKSGAHIYLPKDLMIEIPEYLADLVASSRNAKNKNGRWFFKLLPFFNQNFGPDWKKGDPKFWNDFKDIFKFTREELDEIL